MKAKKRKNDGKTWIGLDKIELPSHPGHYRYLRNYDLEFLIPDISEIFEDLSSPENEQLSEKIQLLKRLLAVSTDFNTQIQHYEDKLYFHLQNYLPYQISKIEPDNILDSLVDDCIKSLKMEYERFKPMIDEYIEKINPENKNKLTIKVKFWSSIWSSIFKAFKNR